MLRAILGVIVVCLCVTPAFCQSAGNSSGATAEVEALRQIEAELLHSEMTTDLAVYERVLADDYVNLNSRGLGPGKSEILAGMRPHAGHAPPYSAETDDMHIYVLGDSAVVALVKLYTAKANGHLAREEITHVFNRDQGGAWKLKISRASSCPTE